MTGLFRNATVLAVALPLVAACGTPAYEPLSPDFGNAVHHNMAQHIINPDPPVLADGTPSGNGARAAMAFNRYEAGRVAKPQAMATSDIKATVAK